MTEIIIQLHPGRLSNPDLDIRYRLPSELEKLAEGDLLIEDDGYDYSDDGQSLDIFLKVSDSKLFWEKAREFLETTKILENNILSAAIVKVQLHGEEPIVLWRFGEE